MTMPAWTLLLIGWIGPEPPVLRETVDQLEVNHFFDEHGKLVFDQYIFREWHYSGEFRIVDWRLCKSVAQQPLGNRVLWWDGDKIRDVRAVSVKETWTQYDVELLERERLPKEFRRELLPGGRRK